MVRTYLRQVLSSWWNLLSALGVVFGVVSGVSGFSVPPWIWITLVVAGLVLAQAQVYLISHPHHDRPATPSESADAAEPRAAQHTNDTPATTQPDAEPAQAARVVPSLNRGLLQGRIYPYDYLAVVQPTEQALCIRTAAAVGIPTQPSPLIESDHQARFQSLIRDCSFETWLTAFTAPWSTTLTQAIVWSAVNPTRSTILTLARPSSYTLHPGWLVDARAAINLTPYISTQPAGMAWLNLDLIIRPNPAHEQKGLPLSLDDLFGVLCVQLATVLDELLPSFMPDITGCDHYELHAVASVMTATAAPLGNFIPPTRSAWQRVDGAHDPIGGDWAFDSYLDAEDPNRRAAIVKAWLKTLLRDAGISGHETSIDNLATPQSSGSG